MANLFFPSLWDSLKQRLDRTSKFINVIITLFLDDMSVLKVQWRVVAITESMEQLLRSVIPIIRAPRSMNMGIVPRFRLCGASRCRIMVSGSCSARHRLTLAMNGSQGVRSERWLSQQVLRFSLSFVNS